MNNGISIDNFNGLNNLVAVYPFSGNCNYWLSDNQHFELSESGKRIFIVDNRDRIVKTFNIKSIVCFGYKKD